jgi:hypothetical protein
LFEVINEYDWFKENKYMCVKDDYNKLLLRKKNLSINEEIDEDSLVANPAIMYLKLIFLLKGGFLHDIVRS